MRPRHMHARPQETGHHPRRRSARSNRAVAADAGPYLAVQDDAEHRARRQLPNQTLQRIPAAHAIIGLPRRGPRLPVRAASRSLCTLVRLGTPLSLSFARPTGRT